MKTLSLAILTVMTASLGFSEVIYNSGPVDPGTGATGSDLKTTSDGFFPRQIADVFSLQSAAQVTGLRPYSFTTIAPQAFVVSGVAVPEPRMVAVFVLVGGMLLHSGLRLRSRSRRTRAGM